MFKPVSPKLDVTALEEAILKFWKSQKIFEKTTEQRKGAPEYVFFEGPPTANGKPGVHHVEARAFKDMFPRYKIMNGFHVSRRGGWDTHGLPVEIAVEKKLLSGETPRFDDRYLFDMALDTVETLSPSSSARCWSFIGRIMPPEK